MARIPTLAATTVMAVALAVGVPATPSAADCSGPLLGRDQVTVDRGDTVTVEGTNWGDACYDTGPPPEGEGVLGVPRDHIEIVVVQGDRTIVVARGAADDRYAFSVEVPVPTSLEPGPARIGAQLADEPTYRSDAFGIGVELTVTDAEVPDEILQPVAFVGDRTETAPPTTTATTTSVPAATDEQAGAPAGGVPSADTELNPWPIVGGALAMLVAIALLVFGVRRRIDEEAEDGPGGEDDPER